MALLRAKAPVDYDSQQDGLEHFLSEFKTSPDQIATALGNINIDEDDLSDEYDFMDEDDAAAEQRRSRQKQQRLPRHKYIDLLQKLADRQIETIEIDLDDLDQVRRVGCGCAPPSFVGT